MIKNAALVTFTFAILAFCPFGRAQDQEPTIDSTIALVRASMQADRTALITSGMNFNDKEGAAFWPVYREYQYDRSKLDDSRSAVIKEYTKVSESDRYRSQSDGMANVGLRFAQTRRRPP